MNPFYYTPKPVKDLAKYTFTATTVIGLGIIAYSIQALYYLTQQKQPDLTIKKAKGTNTLDDALKDT